VGRVPAASSLFAKSTFAKISSGNETTEFEV
jgi:hypothetical protein